MARTVANQSQLQRKYIFFDKLSLKKNKLYPKGDLFYLKYGSIKDIKILTEYLYRDATIFMKRKVKNLI